MLRKLSIRAVLCALGLFVLAFQADAQIIHFKLFLKNLDAGNYSFAYSLAAGGGIAGSSEQASTGSNFESAVRWLSDAVLPQDLLNGPVLVLPGPDYTHLGPGVAFGINDPFQTVGSYAYQVIGGADTFFGNRPFWSNGTFTTDLMVLDFDTDGGANAISNPMNPLDLLSPQVAGFSLGIDGGGFVFQRAARWNHLNDPASPLDLIPDPLDGFGGGNDSGNDIASDGVIAGSVTEFGSPTIPFATYWEASPSTAMKFGWAAFDLSEAFSIVKTGGGDYVLGGYMDDGTTQRAALWVNPGDTGAGRNILKSYGEPILTGAPTGADPDAHVVLLPLVPGMTAARAFDVYYDEFNGEVYVKGETYDGAGVPYAFEWVSSDPTHARLITDFINNGHSYDSATSVNKVGGTIEFVGRATNLDPLATGPNKTKAFVATDDAVMTLTMSAGAVTPPATLTGTVAISNVPDATTYTIKLTKDHPNISIPSSVSITLPLGVHSGSARFRATVSALGAGTAPVGHIIALMIDGNPLNVGFPFMRQRVVAEIGIGGWLKNIVASPAVLRPGQTSNVTVNLNKPAPFSGLNVPITLTTEVTNLLSMTFTAPSTGGGLSGNLFVPPGATSATFTMTALTGQGNITPNTPLGNDTSQKTYSLKATQGSTETVTTGSVVKRWLDKVQIIAPDGSPTNVMSSGLAYKVRIILKAPATADTTHLVVVTNTQPGLYPFSPAPPGPGTLNLIVPTGAGTVDSAPFVVNTPGVPSTPMLVTATDTVDGNVETVNEEIRPLVKSFIITPPVIHTGDVAFGTLLLNSKVTTTPVVTSSDPANLTPGGPTSADGGLTWNIPLTHPNPITVSEDVRLIAIVLGQSAEAHAFLRPQLSTSPISGPVSFTGFNVPAGRAIDFGSPNSTDVFKIVTVTLNDAPAGDVTVGLTASDPRVHIVPITSTTPNGTNTVQFRLTADETTAGAYTSNLTATATKNASTESFTTPSVPTPAVTVQPWLASMTPGSVSVPRGGTTTLTVGLSGKVPSLINTLVPPADNSNTTIPITVVSLNLSAGTVATNPLVFNSGNQFLPETVRVLTTTRARSFVVNASRNGTAKQTTVSIR